MKDTLQLLLDDFHDELSRVLALVRLVDQLRQFATAVPPTQNGDLDFGANARQLHRDVRTLSAEMLTLSGTLLMYAVGRFEGFVRRSVEEVSDLLAAKCRTFDHLPEKMKESLVSQTAEVLARPTRYGFDSVQMQAFIVNLSTNILAQNGLGRINSACLSVTEQNMRPAILAELYKRLGISAIWSEISKQSDMKMFFQTTADGDAEKQAKAILDELMDVRNQIAHPTSIPTFPDLVKMERYISFLDALSGVLADVSRVQVHAFVPKP